MYYLKNWARFPFDLGNYFCAAVVAEWLRRLTRNQIPSGSAGSNPADCVMPTFAHGGKCRSVFLPLLI